MEEQRGNLYIRTYPIRFTSKVALNNHFCWIDPSKFKLSDFYKLTASIYICLN